MVTILILAFYHPDRVANKNYANLPPVVHVVRVDYLDIGKSRGEVAALETRLKQIGVNMVAVSAGRSDWTYFPWLAHPDRWSDEVRTTGHNYLLEDSLRFGKWTHVSAVVDMLAPLYIQSHPYTAAISWLDHPSKNLVSTMELVDGPFGRDLLDMIDNIATHYPVNSITLTELVYYTDGYGEQDKSAYTAYTGRSDWPRTADGHINIDDSSIGTWRSYEIGRFLEKAASIVHRQGKLFFVEVRIGVDSEGQVFANKGTDFNLFLVYADRLIVRCSYDPNSRNPQAISEIAQYLAHYQYGRVIMSIGLWDKDYDPGVAKSEMSSISAAVFQSVLQAASQAGVEDYLVTPSFLMSDAHWQVLEEFWEGK
ncbi:MAG: hypothetical protein NTV38_04105 [Chloroflexi bacterium]|nr:hypothetical protein [Chloroflexota bacterium]